MKLSALLNVYSFANAVACHMSIKQLDVDIAMIKTAASGEEVK